MWKKCDLIWVWFEILWFYLKSFQIPQGPDCRPKVWRHCCSRRRTMTNGSFIQSEIQELNYLELTIMNICKTIAIFARSDSYYVLHQQWWKGVAPLPWGAMALALCFFVIHALHALCTADMPTPVHGQESSTCWSSTLLWKRRRTRLFQKIDIVVKLICDLIWFGPKWFGFDLIICDLICDLPITAAVPIGNLKHDQEVMIPGSSLVN